MTPDLVIREPGAELGQDEDVVTRNYFCISVGPHSHLCVGSHWSQAGDQPDDVSDMSAGEVFIQHTECLPLAIQQRQHQARQTDSTCLLLFHCMSVPGLSTPTLTAGAGQHISM